MTDKQIMIDGVDVSGCEYCLKMTKYRCTIQRDVYKCLCEENPNCYYKQLKRLEFKLKVTEADYEASEQEREALQMSDNEAREIIAELKAECKELRRSILKIFACLIKANKDKIIDTLWVDNVTTLWDYAALTLGVEGDQMQIEKQILREISEVLDD